MVNRLVAVARSAGLGGWRWGEETDPDQALIAGDRDLGGGAVFQYIEQRHDAARREVQPDAVRAVRILRRRARPSYLLVMAFGGGPLALRFRRAPANVRCARVAERTYTAAARAQTG